MAPAHVQSNVASTGGATSLAVALTGVAAGNLLVLGIATSGAGTTVTGVSDGVNTWAQVLTRLFVAGGGGTEVWAAYNVAAGNPTVTASFSASVSSSIHLHEVSGCAIASAFDQSAGATGTSTTPDSGNTPTTTVADEYLFGFMSHGGSPTFTEATGFMTRQTGTFIAHSADKIVSVTDAYNYNPTFGASAAWSARIATFKAAAGNPWYAYQQM